MFKSGRKQVTIRLEQYSVDLRIALEAAHRAAKVAYEGWLTAKDKPLSIEHKGVVDLVTEYDRRAEKEAITWIQENCPHDAIVAEESGCTSGQSAETAETGPITAKTGTEPPLAETGTEPPLAETGTEPPLEAKTGTEPPLENTQPSEIKRKKKEKKGTEPASELASAEPGSAPAAETVAETGTEPPLEAKTAETGTEPPLENTQPSEIKRKKKGTEPASELASAEPGSAPAAETGTEPPLKAAKTPLKAAKTAKTGTEPPLENTQPPEIKRKKKGTEPASELASAEPGSEPGSATDSKPSKPGATHAQAKATRPRLTAKRVWHVDPLDGTTNFAHGFPAFCASVALMIDGKTEAAAIVAPVLGWEFVALRGHGALLNGRPIHVSSVPNLDKALAVTGFPYSRRTRRQELSERIEIFLGSVQGLRRIGAAALDLCFVACGWMDAYFETDLNSWDLAAGVLLVEEAGGKVTDWGGGPVSQAIASGAAAATNGHVHSELIEILQKIRNKEMPK